MEGESYMQQSPSKHDEFEKASVKSSSKAFKREIGLAMKNFKTPTPQ